MKVQTPIGTAHIHQKSTCYHHTIYACQFFFVPIKCVAFINIFNKKAVIRKMNTKYSNYLSTKYISTVLLSIVYLVFNSSEY